MTEGIKYNEGKPRLSLLPDTALTFITSSDPELEPLDCLVNLYVTSGQERSENAAMGFAVCLRDMSSNSYDQELMEVVHVLEFGAKKYSEDNWKGNSEKDYIDACFRHIDASHEELRDSESGWHHLAHAACCFAFISWLSHPDNRTTGYR